MQLSKLKLIPLAAILSLLGVTGGARAEAYGYSYDNIFGLTITNPTGVISVAGTVDLSRATATLNGSSVVTGGAGVLDATQAARGAVAIGGNIFSPQGMTPTGYARGDAQIIGTQFPAFPAGATSTQAVGAAEALVSATGSADAAGRNGSSTGFAVDFSVTSPTATVAFNFAANPFMRVFLNLLAGAGSLSTANLATSFTITNAAGATVFNWAPDGVLGSAITGGTETADAANLNINLSTNTLTAGTLFTYDPTACGAPAGSATATSCGGLFAAVSNPLVAGNYTLTLNALESVDLLLSQVPEPGTVALLGLGLAGLCLGGRRKHAA